MTIITAEDYPNQRELMFYRYFPGATSSAIVNKTDKVPEGKPELLIVHVGTNDLTNNVNLLKIIIIIIIIIIIRG